MEQSGVTSRFYAFFRTHTRAACNNVARLMLYIRQASDATRGALQRRLGCSPYIDILGRHTVV